MESNNQKKKDRKAMWVVTGVVAVVAAGTIGGALSESPVEKAITEITTTTTTTQATTTTTQAPTTTTQAPTTTTEGITRSQQNAYQLAMQYLNFTYFSRQGLIDQLEYEGFSTADATFGVDRVGEDWDIQAWLMAEQYLDSMPFSRQGLIDQLIYEGFTKAQATFGVDQTGL